MGKIEPSKTQRFEVTAELEDAGFSGALEIGRGGFGAVFRCTQTELNRVVAVKILTADLDDENRERFVREQQAMGRLTGHPNIVGVLQVGTTNTGRPYLVMPYYSQGSLETRVRHHGPLTVEETLRLGVKTAGALETAHRAGILHRDVKPGNILFTDYGEPVLTDFGIARLAGGFETADGSVAGSPSFTAPEVLGGHPPSPASDVYGLGATLFAALTGHAAFERHSGEQLVAQFVRITSDPVPGLREDAYGEDLSAVVERAMSRNPAERPSPAALGDALRDIQSGRGLPVDEMAVSADQLIGSAEAQREGRASPASDYHVVRPPLIASNARGGLPLQLTSFVGRRTELAETKHLLSKSRLVTLTGTGGVGKTRLALQAATSARRDFRDGVCLVELGELRDGALLPGVIAGALGLRQQGRPVLEMLSESLASRQLVLVLDNCEQIVDAAAQVAEDLLRTCPKLRILATSREALGVGGEATLRVPPLTVPDPSREPDLQGAPAYEAVNLFVDRAAAAVPGFTLTEDNTATVARICNHLDGLPLSIELAAARLRALSPEQILQRLTDRYALLTRGSRGAPHRQRALQSCIDWSYELCTPDEQQVWAQLSVFAGTLELDAAEYVCSVAHGLDMVDVLTSLVDKSILIREDSGATVRFRLLETLQAYGRQKLEQSEHSAAVRRRHLDWYWQLALNAEAEWISPSQLDWIARLDRGQPNLREALDYCLANEGESEDAVSFAAAIQPFWVSHGQLSEGRYWLDRALSRPSSATAIRAKALYRNCTMAEAQGDRVAATAMCTQAKALAEESDDTVVRMFVAFTEGLHELYGGNFPRACSSLETALERCIEHNDISTQMMVTLALGLAHERSGNAERAMACYGKALEMTESLGDSVYRSYASWAMALATWRQGDRDRAVLLLRQALRLTRQQQDPVMTAAALEALAWVGYSDSNARQSAVLMGAAHTLGEAAGTSSVTVPHVLNHHEECEQVALRALGQRVYKAAYREGTSLSLDAATSFALGEQPDAAAFDPAPFAELTKRERQVADLVAEGLTNKAIAARLVISVRTAQGHVEHILSKLGFTSRSQIAAWIAEQR